MPVYDIFAVFRNGRHYKARVEKLSAKLCALLFDVRRCKRAQIPRIMPAEELGFDARLCEELGFELESNVMVLQYGFPSVGPFNERGAGGYWVNLVEVGRLEGVELKQLAI